MAIVLAISLWGAGFAVGDETVNVCVGQVNDAFGPSASAGQFSAPLACPLAITTTGGAMSQGASAHWEADAPAGLAIVGAAASLNSHDVNAGSTGQYGGGFYWGGGGGAEITPGETTCFSPALDSPDFGFFLVAANRRARRPARTSPFTRRRLSFARRHRRRYPGRATGLWASTIWVRGSWRAGCGQETRRRGCAR